MNNTPTPKSDKNTYNKHQDNCPTSVVPSLICRQLERELTAAREELEAVTEQRDRLAEALNKMISICSCKTEDIDTVNEIRDFVDTITKHSNS